MRVLAGSLPVASAVLMAGAATTVTRIAKTRILRKVGLPAVLCATAGLSAFAATSHVAPAIERFGTNLGLEDPSTPLTLTVWLNLHNRADFDSRVQALYTAGSPTFHQWLSNDDFKAYAPTSSEIAAVQAELKAHGLAVQSVDPYNFSVRVEGTTANVESAFHTQISRYSVKGQIVRTTSSVPQLSGAAAGLVAQVAGLNSMAPKSTLLRSVNPQTKQPFAGRQVTAASKTEGLKYASQCFYAPSKVVLSGVSGKDDKTPVSETFSGLIYGANPNNTEPGTLSPCGYSPQQVQNFYGMNTAYGLGYTGTGQTVVIIEEGINAQAEIDGNVFNKMYTLPEFTSGNYQVFTPYPVSHTGAYYNDDQSADLDVEYVHAMAPGAKIALVQIGPDAQDFQAAILYAVENHLGNTISIDEAEPEAQVGAPDLAIFNEMDELAAAAGISVHVPTDNDGDYTVLGIAADVNGFASSPYDTAVGGTTIGASPTDGRTFTVGWGNNTNQVSQAGNRDNPTMEIYVPPTTFEFFYAGSNGGVSKYFDKPTYQAALSGSGRHLPDVSALADPYTGAEFVYDVNGVTYVSVVGGVGLSADLFSGMWAVITDAYENRGGGTGMGKPLGQAAPYIAASAATPFIEDVVPFSGPANVTASETDPSGTTHYSAVDLSQPLYTTTDFVSAFFDYGYGFYSNLTFGTDSSLRVTQGWDDVTGYGTPNVGALFSELGVKPK